MDNDTLMHYGVLGMKWGVRRYENEDGSLTSLGKKKKEYDELKKEARGYHEYIGNGAYAVWPNRKAFVKAVDANTKKQVKQTKGFQNKLKIMQDAKRYKDNVDITDMTVKAYYREAAKRVKDSMKAEIKNVPVSQVTKGRHKTELILSAIGTTLFVGGLIGGYSFLEYKSHR